MPPSEPRAEWYPILLIAFAVAGTLVWGWYRYVMGRLDKDRSKLHEHAGQMQLHGYRLDEHGERIAEVERGVHDLKEKGKP